MERNFSIRKILFLMVAIISVVLVGAITLSSCGDSVSDIVIKDTDMPRTTYVEGQELDLSKGVLTAIVNGSETSIPLTDPAVSVSGYDKTKLGKQTVTVTYNEKTTTFEVNVVSRVVAEGYKSEYFINDPFDATQGKLKITKDDGKYLNVKLDSELITLKTFDNTKAGESVITVVYNDNAGTSYEASFTVTFYEVGEVSFTKPSKTVYASHDGELSLAGGFFTVKAKGSNLTSYVPLTISMQEGFDLSKATAEHRTTPLQQTIKFTYANQSFDFKISILYSGVSVVKDAAKALSDVEITGKNTVLDPDLAAIAVDAATEYFKLTKAKKDLIDEEDVLKVMRPAAFAVTEAFGASAEKYSEIFVLDSSSGDILINAQSYATLKAAITSFSDKDDPFNVLADVLSDMKEEFKDVFLFTENDDKGEPVEYTMANFIKAPAQDQRSFYKELFNFMLGASDKLEPVPTDWSMDPSSEKYLGNYAKYITDAFSFISKSKYLGPNFNGPFNSISAWRGGDFFEIIYNYYIYVAEDSVKSEFLTNLIGNQGYFTCPLPGEVQDWYTYLNRALAQISGNMVVTKNGETTYYALYDTTLYMYYYEKTVELANSIMNGNDELTKTVFDLIGGEMMTYNNIEAPYASNARGEVHPHGYLYFVSMSPESEAFYNARKAYMELATIYFEEGRLVAENYENNFKQLFGSLAELTPTELYSFITSVNFLYGSSDEFVLDYSEKFFSYFTLFVGLYENKTLSTTEALPYRQLLKAMELCAQIGAKATVEDFRLAMAELKAMMEGDKLSAEDKAAFMAVAGECYTKYLGISETVSAPTDFGGFEDKYNDLKNTIKNFFTVYANLVNEDLTVEEQKAASQYYLLLFSLSEKILDLRASLADAPDAVVNALYTVNYDLNGTSEMTMECAYAYVSSFYYGQLLRQQFAIAENVYVSFWTLFSATENLRPFMVNLADSLMAYYNDQTPDIESIRNLMEDFRELVAAEVTLFYMFGNTLYYNMLLDVFTKDNADIADFVKKLLQSELCYIDYLKDPSDSGRKQYFLEYTDQNGNQVGMKFAIDAYVALGDKAESLDEAIKEMYNYYKGIYDELKA